MGRKFCMDLFRVGWAEAARERSLKPIPHTHPCAAIAAICKKGTDGDKPILPRRRALCSRAFDIYGPTDEDYFNAAKVRSLVCF